MIAEWMAINPCEGCSLWDKRNNRCNAMGRTCDMKQDSYKDGYGQKRLLEHLPMYSIKQGNIDGIDCWCIPKSRIIQMRKQLEDNGL